MDIAMNGSPQLPNINTLPKRPLKDALYRHQTAGHNQHYASKKHPRIFSYGLCTRFAILFQFFSFVCSYLCFHRKKQAVVGGALFGC